MREVSINKITTYLSSKYKALRSLILASKDRLIFVAIFIVIAIPVIMLLSHSYTQLQTSSLFGYKEHAFSVLQNLNKNITADLAIEDRRSYADYRFIRSVPVFGGEEITMSELAEFPQRSHYVGLVGHFQLDPAGNLSTPVLPDGVLERIPMVDRAKRVAIRNKISQILNTSGFSAISSPVAFAMTSSSMEKADTTHKNDSRLIDQIYKQDIDIASTRKKKKSSKHRVEQITETGDFAFGVESTKLDTTGLLVRLINTETTHSMEAEIDFFQAIVDSNYIIFHRTVRRGTDVFIQGFIVDARAYLTNLVKNEIEKYKGVTKGNQQDPLVLAFFHKNKSFVAFGERNNITTELLSESLQAPLSDITFKMYTTQRAPGGEFVTFIGFLMLAVLAIGLISIYHVTQSRMKLASKRQDFVSAITHELKTPLTAIKMYAELLQNSWVASEEKKQKYYGQIASEADRLSRLIQNVLNLSKLDGNRWNVQLRMDKPKQVLDDFISTYSKNVEKQGFELTVSSDTDADNISLMIDRDAIMQILMNLVDNSLKFSKNADYKMINVELRIKGTDMYLAVRDFGPGIPPSEMKKVFQEFYRVENEMTRQTSGTGIGLSMVKKLCALCNMTIELENANPGLRTKIHFPSLSI
ncbi:sensory box histidine kinase [Fibrobacter succinogenes subsp. succinogenes S85]|uniref:histidine kinase n=1 Tax=Fibrobacter succinogenes (strain ATCC 19169 / S85) TaxID=59374 RepID=C9RQT4_FIBSS|nr:HAMP domain-containing sensor histidine kinase [Fibrobacter succinogenes]ACX74920.1 integral membrane sensor signal transduction histidine kinase [Fibrobacter succinogenes subsp. succinogenes S85]ADL26727.1 sensory box histidine kinase [Fibrobacter succinogenes subsp. succinogenes S85]